MTAQSAFTKAARHARIVELVRLGPIKSQTELAHFLAGHHFTFDNTQNFSPPSRAASARALTRPWYR